MAEAAAEAAADEASLVLPLLPPVSREACAYARCYCEVGTCVGSNGLWTDGSVDPSVGPVVGAWANALNDTTGECLPPLQAPVGGGGGDGGLTRSVNGEHGM